LTASRRQDEDGTWATDNKGGDGQGQRRSKEATAEERDRRQETAQQTTDYEVRVVVMRFYFIPSEKWKVGREQEVEVEEGRGVMWLDGIPTTWRGDDASQ